MVVDEYALELLRISDALRDATPAVCACGRRRLGLVSVYWSYAENRWICQICFFRGR